MKVQSLTKKFMLLLVCFTMLFTMSLLAGCKGDNGASGANGATGATGPAGPVTTTNESCMVCHKTGALADVAVMHPDPANDTLIVTVTSVENVGGFPKVNFHVDRKYRQTGNLASYTTITFSNQSFKIADLIPAGTVTQPSGTVYGTDYYEMWVSETAGKLAAPACAAGTKLDTATKLADGLTNPTYNTCIASATSTGSLATPATNALVNSGSGNYSYTFVTPFGSAWPSYNNADYAAANKKRVVIEMSSPPTGFNKAIGVLDFDGDPGSGNIATAIDSQRQFVTIQACQKCHGPLMDGAAHANSRNDIRACDFCHSALYGSGSHAVGFMVEDTADLPVFIHKIHAAKEVPAFEERMEGYTAVTYPQNVKDCVVCHVNLTGASLGTGDKIDNWKTNPTARVCSSCHTGNTVNADGSMIHDPSIASTPTGTRIATSCAGCHVATADAADIVNAHAATVASADIPEYDVTLVLTAPANGTHYVTGETFTVDATLTLHGTATPVPTSVYTTAQDAAYVSGGGLRTASLYVYGPRSLAKPLLGTQALSLFGKGDATGFHYAVTVPANATAGTYMVRARFGDYSYNRSVPGPAAHPYQIESIALTTIKIGTADDQKKVAGDACINCHGATTMHTNDHVAPFDTDHCLSCHDQNQPTSHGAQISNRVHAVHSASATGDMNDGRDWSEITYPQSTKTCVTCHTSGATTYKTNVYETPCLGCHGDNPGATDHMLQNGGIYQKAQ